MIQIADDSNRSLPDIKKHHHLRKNSSRPGPGVAGQGREVEEVGLQRGTKRVIFQKENKNRVNQENLMMI